MATAKRALIVGLGVTGMSAALALKQQGWTPVIIERARQRRTGGYFIGLQKTGLQAAEQLGVAKDIHIRNALNSYNWDILPDGTRMRIAGYADSPARPQILLRGDIEAGLYRHIEQEQIEIRFGTTVVKLANQADEVMAVLGETQGENGREYQENFDLVVGADGMRSTVRRLVFGADELFLRPVGSMICAYQLCGAMPNFPEQDGITICEPNRALWVFPFGDHTSTVLFTYRTKDINGQFAKPALQTLKDVFAGMDDFGITQKALADLEKSEDFLFDSVNLVKMPRWSKGRIVLVGDSAWCLSLYSGMGASAGIKGAYELAQAIGQYRDVPTALQQWEKGMRPFIRKHQLSIPVKSQLFVPSRPVYVGIRRVLLRLLGLRLAYLKKKAQKKERQA